MSRNFALRGLAAIVVLAPLAASVGHVTGRAAGGSWLAAPGETDPELASLRATYRHVHAQTRKLRRMNSLLQARLARERRESRRRVTELEGALRTAEIRHQADRRELSRLEAKVRFAEAIRRHHQLMADHHQRIADYHLRNRQRDEVIRSHRAATGAPRQTPSEYPSRFETWPGAVARIREHGDLLVGLAGVFERAESLGIETSKARRLARDVTRLDAKVDAALARNPSDAADLERLSRVVDRLSTRADKDAKRLGATLGAWWRRHKKDRFYPGAFAGSPGFLTAVDDIGIGVGGVDLRGLESLD